MDDLSTWDIIKIYFYCFLLFWAMAGCLYLGYVTAHLLGLFAEWIR